MTEEIDVYEVQLINRVSKEVLKQYDAGSDYDKAVQIQDQWNLTYVDSTNFTRIEIYSEEVEE